MFNCLCKRVISTIRYMLLILFFCSIHLNILAQKEDCHQINKLFKKALYKDLKYPYEAIDNREEGRVFVQFQVDYNGRIDSIQIIKGIGLSFDKLVLERIKQISDTIILNHCGSRKLSKKHFKPKIQVVSLIFKIDNLDSIYKAKYKSILGRITKKEWPKSSLYKIEIEPQNEFLEYGEELAFNVKFINNSKRDWILTKPDSSVTATMHYFMEKEAYAYNDSGYPITPRIKAIIGYKASENENFKSYEKALQDSISRDIIEWLAPKIPNQKITINANEYYSFKAYLPKPYSFEIGKKYYCWIEFKEGQNKVVSNTLGFKIEITTCSIEKIIKINEEKSKNFMLANSIFPEQIFYILRGENIHKKYGIDEKDWKIAYLKASEQFKQWWIENKNSVEVQRIIKEINRGLK